MKMQVQIQRTAEALHDDHAAAAAGLNPGIARPFSQHPEHGTSQDRGPRPAPIMI